MDDHWVLDLAATFDVTDRLSLFGRVENVLDEKYLVSRRPAGARPGRPHTGLLGVNFRF